jgi:hypothetical protein
MRAISILTALGLALAMTACSGDDDAAAPATVAADAPSDTPDTASAAAITISNFTFEGVTEVTVGTTVVVTNADRHPSHVDRRRRHVRLRFALGRRHLRVHLHGAGRALVRLQLPPLDDGHHRRHRLTRPFGRRPTPGNA